MKSRVTKSRKKKIFDFGNANEAQRKAITTTEGPVLITAGPGTGKTYTLVQRAIYLIKECGVRPENIFIATFTEKAAKELITRITNALSDRGISVNLNEMYIGTFHSLCLRILKDHVDFIKRLHKNYRLMDAFDQQYMVYQNIDSFRKAEEKKPAKPLGWQWEQAALICKCVNNLTEELVTPEELMSDSEEEIAAVGYMLKKYNEMLAEQNLLDFSSLQVEVYRLLKERKEVLNELRSRFTHIMVDEYQDTNYIQEQLVFLLGGKHKNICVVGDDDQGLYRFRGATIRNILEFPKKFARGKCCIIPLVTNYRSNSDIVDFYNQWMDDTEVAGFKWGKFRYEKRIKPHKKSALKSPAVVTISGIDEDQWHEKILTFIRKLKKSKKIQDYNQIAFLFSSVKNQKVQDLANFLELKGVNVYSPRSGMFFEREEIRLTLGCLLHLFPNYKKKLKEGSYNELKIKFKYGPYKNLDVREYYLGCIKETTNVLKEEKDSDIITWIKKTGRLHTSLEKTVDYAYSGLMYKLFQFAPFSRILDTDMDVGVVDIRPARNLALLTQLIGKFEYLNQIDVLSSKEYKGERKIDRDTEKLFNEYLRLLLEGGMDEYEDDSEYAPSGCVSFLTIHQAKGMEFPIVLVDSLSSFPRKNQDDILEKIGEKCYKRPAFEPSDLIKFFDFWRLFYTAFSRAQDLLVLTSPISNRTPSKYFRRVFAKLPIAASTRFKLNEFDFQPIKDVSIKKTYSFTSHIAVYETCALQYKFYKELGFTPVRAGAMLFGTLVHQTIEDVHKAVIRNERDTIEDKLPEWFEDNYDSLSKTNHTYLAEKQKEAAYNQVRRYVERQKKDWSQIQQAEVDVSLVKPEYIMEGKVDLIKGKGNTLEIVDFKSQKRPDEDIDKEQLEKYRQQLHIYAHLIERRTGQKVSKMHLYYTGEDKKDPLITFPYDKAKVNETMEVFDDTVHKIMRKEFCTKARNPKVCDECDFRHYCRGKEAK